MSTTKQKLNTALVTEEDKTLTLIAEKRLKENGRRLGHDEVWVTNRKSV